jgi:hypothetical protein
VRSQNSQTSRLSHDGEGQSMPTIEASRLNLVITRFPRGIFWKSMLGREIIGISAPEIPCMFELRPDIVNEGWRQNRDSASQQIKFYVS